MRAIVIAISALTGLGVTGLLLWKFRQHCTP
jgi:hypothetical protein